MHFKFLSHLLSPYSLVSCFWNCYQKEIIQLTDTLFIETVVCDTQKYNNEQDSFFSSRNLQSIFLNRRKQKYHEKKHTGTCGMKWVRPFTSFNTSGKQSSRYQPGCDTAVLGVSTSSWGLPRGGPRNKPSRLWCCMEFYALKCVQVRKNHFKINTFSCQDPPWFLFYLQD